MKGKCLESLAGKKIGKLLVISYDENLIKGKGRKCVCKCDCGNTYITWDRIIRYGNRQSCGCLEAVRTQGTYKHGFRSKNSKDRLYATWANMKTRCNNPHSKDFSNYGGRGIKICNEWDNDFITFRNWALANGYSDKLTIDRVDNNKGYNPDNCRWVGKDVQGINKRNCINITYKGKTQTISQWSRKTGINRSTIKYRYSHGYSVTEIFKEAIS